MLRSDHAHKATIRTLRAGRVTQRDAMRQHGQRFEPATGLIDEDTEMLACRDLAATLVHTSKGLSLAVVQILHLERAGVKRQLYDVNLDSDISDVTAFCQVVALKPYWTSVGSSRARAWIWEKGYLAIRDASNMANQKTHTARIPVPRLCHLVPKLVSDTAETSSRHLYKQLLLEEDLKGVRDELWDLLQPSKESIWEEIATLPDARSSPSLPYLDEEGMYDLD